MNMITTKRIRWCAGLVVAWAWAGEAAADAELQALRRMVAADPEPRRMLEEMADDFGGRLTGSEANVAALRRLDEELRALGLEPEWVPFTMPGWERGEDTLRMLVPVERPLRVAALSGSNPVAAFEAEVVDVGRGRAEDYPEGAVAGKVGLVDPSTPLRSDALAGIAAERGLRALLLVNRVNGGQLLARTGSFQGGPLPVPVLGVTQEDGRWMQRLRARGRPVRVRVAVESRVLPPIETANLRVVLPGRTTEKVVVGAHFDSWDLGQGALDNGLGVAQLYALARALRGGDHRRTIELVWFNGEEQGIWGSRVQAERDRAADAPIVAMVNLDMVGVPRAVNALGDASLRPTLEQWNEALGEDRLPLGVQNVNWFGSDHAPYQLAGYRAITFNAPIDPAAVRYYHDGADTIDKVAPEMLAESAAVIATLVRHLANDPELAAFRRDEEATRRLFVDAGLAPRLRGVGFWPEGWPETADVPVKETQNEN